MTQEQTSMKTRLNVVTFIAVFAMILSISLGAYVLTSATKNKKLIVTQGIVIKDEMGKDRILIGTPLPSSEDRVRTDSSKAWATYVEKWPEDYREKVWNWYKDYNHSANGIVILSDTGYDRVAIGDPTPDPCIGKRIAPGTGMTLMDEKGFERSGYAIMNFDGQYKVVLGLDSDKGSEGLALVVDDYGYNGIIVPGKERTIFLGNADTSFYATQPHDKYNGLIIRSRDSVLVDIH